MNGRPPITRSCCERLSTWNRRALVGIRSLVGQLSLLFDGEGRAKYDGLSRGVFGTLFLGWARARKVSLHESNIDYVILWCSFGTDRGMKIPADPKSGPDARGSAGPGSPAWPWPKLGYDVLPTVCLFHFFPCASLVLGHRLSFALYKGWLERIEHTVSNTRSFIVSRLHRAQ